MIEIAVAKSEMPVVGGVIEALGHADGVDLHGMSMPDFTTKYPDRRSTRRKEAWVA